MKSNKPFDETLRQLLELEGISGRELSRRTEKQSGWGSVPTVSRLVRGDLTPSVKAMKSIASAFKVLPETFAEYRLWKARDELDPGSVGLKKALRNLAATRPETEAQDKDNKPPRAAPERRIDPEGLGNEVRDHLQKPTPKPQRRKGSSP